MRIELNGSDWWAGYDAGYAGRGRKHDSAIDGLSFISGYIEGQADREFNRPHQKERIPANRVA